MEHVSREKGLCQPQALSEVLDGVFGMLRWCARRKMECKSMEQQFEVEGETNCVCVDSTA